MPKTQDFQIPVADNAAATIAISTALSAAVDLVGTTLAGYYMPAAWTAASITLQASVDGTNFINVYDSSGNEEVHTVTVDRYIKLAPATTAGYRYVKFRSGTSATPVNQAAERIIPLAVRPV